jgi:spermidine synthase
MTKRIPSHLPAVLVLGAVSQIAQVLFLRELLMAFQGSELSIGIILAAWLAWVGVGSHLGAHLVERIGRPGFLFALSAVGIVVTLPATILFMRGLRVVFTGPPGSYLSLLDMIVASFLLMAPTCLLLGGQFVLLSRIWRESEQAHGASGAGKTYAGEAVGNMIGGLLFAFLMVHLLNSFQSAFLAAILMLAALLFLTRRLALLAGRFRLIPGALLAALALAFLFSNELDAWAYRLQWRYFIPHHRLVETHQSKHGTISVVQREDQYSFFQSGHLLFTTAGPEAVIAGLEDQEAVEFAHFAMVQHENPASVLLIGGGLRGTLREIIKHPVERVDYIELDEVLTTAARPYVSPTTLVALADPRVRLIHTDGRLFVKSTQEKYDLIIADVPDPATAVLNRYYTKEFFVEAGALLKPEGVFVIGATSTPDLRGVAVSNRNATLYHTLSSVFPQVALAGDRFLYFFASHSPGQVSLDAELLQRRYLERGIEAAGFSPQHYLTLLQESQLRRVNWIIRNHGRSRDAHLLGPAGVPLTSYSILDLERMEEQWPAVQQRYFINSDLKPIAYYYSLVYLDELTRAEGGSGTLRWLLQFQFWWMLPFFALPLSIVSALRMMPLQKRRGSDTRLAVLFMVLAAGFSTMALQIALLFSFQSIYGFIYELVGLIMALFMGGLALGAHIANRYVKNKTSKSALVGVQLLIGLIAALIALFLPTAAGLPSPSMIFVLFSAFTFAAGLANGVHFPLTAACWAALTRSAEKSAGSVYGGELGGACVGAALASVVVAPILGIVACCLMAGMANLTAVGVILISRGLGRYE